MEILSLKKQIEAIAEKRQDIKDIRKQIYIKAVFHSQRKGELFDDWIDSLTNLIEIYNLSSKRIEESKINRKNLLKKSIIKYEI